MQSTLVVLDGELAVPCNPKSAHAGLKILDESSDSVWPFVVPEDVVELA